MKLENQLCLMDMERLKIGLIVRPHLRCGSNEVGLASHGYGKIEDWTYSQATLEMQVE